MLRTLVRLVVAVLALVGVTAVAVMVWLLAGGISTAREPVRLETVVARRLRSAAIPASERNRTNPVGPTRDVIEAGMAHYADHCAGCHANDGSGDTEVGRNFYPRPPDMRQSPTQSLTDGELFYIIERGVRFTGMPAWPHDAGESGDETWRLVQFIRYLPKLTDAEQQQMRARNPKTLEEWMEEEKRGNAPAGQNPSEAPVHRHAPGGARDR